MPTCLDVTATYQAKGGPMATPSAHTITQLLLDWSAGDETALEQLIPLVKKDLRNIAQFRLYERRMGHVLQPTELVDEAYLRLRLIDISSVEMQNRAQFFAYLSRIMRNILVDIYRENRHRAREVQLDEALAVSSPLQVDLVALDDALRELATFDERKSHIVELRFFGGLTVEETAEVMKISPRQVAREWAVAKKWLYRELSKK